MSQNAIIGDASGIDLPESQIDPTLISDEKAKARFSKTKEFQKLKAYAEERIRFYETFLPNGEPVQISSMNFQEKGANWVVANAVIGEFKALIGEYETAAEVVNEILSS